MPQKDDTAILRDANACRGLDADITAATCSPDEFAEYPGWMRFTLTDAMIDTLMKLRATCKANDLEDISVYEACDVGPCMGEECRTDLDRLRVYDGGFFVLEANIKNTDVHFETIPLFFDDFFADVAGGRRFIASEGHDDAEDAALQETVTEDESDMESDADAA